MPVANIFRLFQIHLSDSEEEIDLNIVIGVFSSFSIILCESGTFVADLGKYCCISCNFVL